MFQGAAQLNLDSKGRLAIPARYRDMLLEQCAGQLVLTADADGCLLVYPQPEWQPILSKLLALSALDPRIRALQRRLIGYAEDIVMDAAGRVLISPALRSYAVLNKRVMLIGQGKKFELWDEAKWLVQQDNALSFDYKDLPPELEGFTL
ncbi:MAG: division/cell wall cluster transcriptional repressor MraZ [Candidatus Nitrotoga sp.]